MKNNKKVTIYVSSLSLFEEEKQLIEKWKKYKNGKLLTNIVTKYHKNNRRYFLLKIKVSDKVQRYYKGI